MLPSRDSISLINCLSLSCYDFQRFPYLAVLIRCKGGAVAAVGDSKAPDPLKAILSPLGLYCCHLGFGSKIHL